MVPAGRGEPARARPGLDLHAVLFCPFPSTCPFRSLSLSLFLSLRGTDIYNSNPTFKGFSFYFLDRVRVETEQWKESFFFSLSTRSSEISLRLSDKLATFQ